MKYFSSPFHVDSIAPWITRWFGLRQNSTGKIQPPTPVYVPYIWAFIGAFGGLAVLQAIFGQSAYFIERGVPPLVASYGASAVLCFGAIDSPLAQPRAVLGGHFISALTGIIYTRIFDIHYHLHDDGSHHFWLAWLAASLATATAIVVMQFTKTIHPPAGATALLPVLDATINQLDWYFLAVVLLSSTMIVAIAMFTNNIQRRYPLFWWSPPSPKKGLSNILPMTSGDTSTKQKSPPSSSQRSNGETE
ncbi:HPP-domain-containing protein [Camillea tinctor]|nr:HPP-domain-containing protein [Camillea tinctor]